MEQQLRILLDPVSSLQTVEPLRLTKQWQNGAIYSISDATMYAYNSDQLIASGSLIGGTLSFDGADENSLKYDWTPTEIDYLTSLGPKAHYRSVWHLNSSDRRTEQWFTITYWRMNSPIDEQDLLMEKPELDSFRVEKPLYATADSSGSLIHCNLLADPSGYYDGSLIEFQGGNANNQTYRVRNWDFLTKTFEIVGTLPATVRQNTGFNLRRSFMPEVMAAWTEILAMVHTWTPNYTSDSGSSRLFRSIYFQSFPQSTERQGSTWAVDGYDFRQMHLHLAMRKVASNLRSRDRDIFDLMYEEFSGYVSKDQTELKAKIDKDRDGKFSDRDGVGEGGKWFV